MLEENEGVQREGKDCAWKNKDNGWPLAVSSIVTFFLFPLDNRLLRGFVSIYYWALSFSTLFTLRERKRGPKEIRKRRKPPSDQDEK